MSSEEKTYSMNVSIIWDLDDHDDSVYPVTAFEVPEPA
jgi:hypothetical protein